MRFMSIEPSTCGRRWPRRWKRRLPRWSRSTSHKAADPASHQQEEEERMLSFVEMRRALFAVCAALMLCGGAVAQTWPDKPVRLIVNFPPGGVADTLARAIAPG